MRVKIIISLFVILIIAGQTFALSLYKKQIEKLNLQNDVLESNNALIQQNYDNAIAVFDNLLERIDNVRNEQAEHLHILHILEKNTEVREYMDCPIPSIVIEWLLQGNYPIQADGSPNRPDETLRVSRL